MKTKEERRQVYTDRQRERYGNYPEWTFFQQLMSLIGYAKSAAEIEKEKSVEEGVEHFKTKVAVNFASEHDFREAGLSEEKCEARRQFYRDYEQCQSVREMCKVVMDFAMKIVEEEQ